jgi:hypothetical protein
MIEDHGSIPDPDRGMAAWRHGGMAGELRRGRRRAERLAAYQDSACRGLERFLDDWPKGAQGTSLVAFCAPNAPVNVKNLGLDSSVTSYRGG